MTIRSTLTRRCAAGLLAAQLIVGAVSTLATAAPAVAATVLDRHDAWQGFTTTLDGDRLFGAITRMNHGGTAAFLITGDTLSLVMTNPDWDFRDGRTVPVRLTIDGETYTGSGTVRGSDMIEMPNVNKEVMGRFIDGAEATLDVNDGDLVWTLDLHGFTQAMADVVRLVKASY